MPLTETQNHVARGMALAVVAIIVAFSISFLAQLPNMSAFASTSSRLKLAALAGLSPAFMLFICIARLAKHRFSTPQDIQGSALTIGTERARLLQALLQNTLEQTALALPVYFAASLFFPITMLSLVITAALLFAVGRVTFFYGYVSGAPSRAAGFGLTFYPTCALLFAVLVLIVRHGAA